MLKQTDTKLKPKRLTSALQLCFGNMSKAASFKLWFPTDAEQDWFSYQVGCVPLFAEIGRKRAILEKLHNLSRSNISSI